MCGVNDALCLPLRRIAICVHRRPSTLSVASTTNQSPRTVSFFANTVDITHSNHGRARAPPTEDFGRRWRMAPLEKGAQVYSTPHAIAKPRLIIAAHGARAQSRHLYLGGRPGPAGPFGAPGRRTAGSDPCPAGAQLRPRRQSDPRR